MKELYQKILNKPESFRRKLAYGITAFLGLIIFSLWLSQTMITIQKTFKSNNKDNESLEEIKKTMPSLKTENLNLPDNLFEGDYLLEDENEEETEAFNDPINSLEEINSMDIKGLELKIPEEDEAKTDKDGVVKNPTDEN